MSGQVARIEAEHGAMMRRLGYQPETVQKEAATLRGEAA